MVAHQVKSSEFYSRQLDKSIDVANLANLLVYVCYLFEGTVHDVLSCCPITTHTTEDIVNLIDNVMLNTGIEWPPCVGVCTDKTKVMTGKHTGLIAHVKKVCSSIH